MGNKDIIPPVNLNRDKAIRKWLDGEFSTALIILDIWGADAVRKYLREGGKDYPT